MPRAGRLARLTAAAALAATGAAACGGGAVEGPPAVPPGSERPATGPSGPQVVVAVGPTDDLEAAVVAADVADLATATGPASTPVRVRVVTFGATAGLADVLAVLVDEADLVCVVAPGARDAIAAVVARQSGATFCEVPAGPDPTPERTVSVAVPLAATAAALGDLARLAAGAARVGVLVATDPVASALRAWARAADEGEAPAPPADRAAEVPPAAPAAGPRAVLATVPGPEAAAAAVADLVEAGVEVLVVDASRGALELARLAAARGMRLVVPTALAEALPADAAAAVVATWDVAWVRAVDAAIARALAAEAVAAGSLGGVPDLVTLRAGPAADAAVRDRIVAANLAG